MFIKIAETAIDTKYLVHLQGAHLATRNNEGLTARSLAFNNNHVRIVTLIDNAIRLQQEEGQLS